MKYKNYRNPRTQDNRIYSSQELYDMPLRELHSRKDELIAQREVLGLPSESELANSENVVHVEAYTRDDGTEVKAHWRSKPRNGVSENYEPQNIQNENKEEAIDDISQEYTDYEPETEEYKAEYRKREKERSIERKDPDEIAGVKRGEPMTLEEAINHGVNPNYNKGDENYDKNCAICVAVLEAKARGFDAEAMPYGDFSSKLLSSYPEYAYKNSKTGLVESMELIPAKNSSECKDWLENNIKPDERYLFRCMPVINTKSKNIKAHVLLVSKTSNGELRFYDAINGKTYNKNFIAHTVFSIEKENEDLPYHSSILRIDNKQLNINVLNNLFKSRSKE